MFAHFVCQGGVIDENEEAVTRKLAALIQHLAGQLHDRLFQIIMH